MFAPSSPEDLARCLTDCAGTGRSVEIVGGGSRQAIGAPREAQAITMRGMAGVVDYDPAELVLVARAGTLLSEVESVVAQAGQRLAFDPGDPTRPVPAAEATIGGAVAGGFSGPGRLSGGSARDHLLGFTAVSGRGEVFRAGGNVVKNVTGYDLSKLIAGSWGRLAAVCELTLKVMPRPRSARTLALPVTHTGTAFAAMAAAMGSRCEVNAAAFQPERALALFRLEGFERSVAARCAMLRQALAPFGGGDPLGEAEAAAYWDMVRMVRPLADAAFLWRIAIPASKGPGLVAVLEPMGARWLTDWAGSLVWLSLDDADAVRTAAAAAGGHAMLARAPADARAAIPAMHPRPPALAALEERVRRGFDPAGIFETGRFLDSAHAD